MSSTLKRAVGPAVAAGLLVTALATPASAQTPGSVAFRIFGTAALSAAEGRENQMSATVSPAGRLILSDLTGVALGPGCTRVSPTSADCGSVSSLTRLAVGMGDLNDTFRGGTISLRTTVDAGTGTDSVVTGAGADTIGVSDDEGGDRVNCGLNRDVVFRDAGDIVQNCEVQY
ncbi:hypothetical protein ACIBAG_22695 [Streptomyces sp. NPDC051243]|uniref:hypothetical protein n=1 Tax=Streptomyces sp. NPDC051243 TaxID=3365646 RepID=UPI003787B9F4